MSGVPDEIMTAREQLSDSDEPILTESIEVLENGDSSLRQTIPSVAVDILGINPDDSLKIEIYSDFYIVSRKRGE